ELALQERESTVNAIVVPVPDTAKAAAEGMAFSLSVPCLEGLMRHRALGRTFIESEDREAKARMKYIPLPEVPRGRRGCSADATIVRSTAMRVRVGPRRMRGGAAGVPIPAAWCPSMARGSYWSVAPEVTALFARRFAAQGEP